MDIQHKEHKRCEVLHVTGRIDSSNAQQFEDALMKALDNKSNVVVNMKNVEYMSSAAIRALIGALKEAQGRTLRKGNVVLAETPDKIREVFGIAALDTLFTFYDNETEAVGSF